MIRNISIRLRITLFLVAAIVLTLGTATWLLDAHIDKEVALQADTNLLERAQALSSCRRRRGVFHEPVPGSNGAIVYGRRWTCVAHARRRQTGLCGNIRRTRHRPARRCAKF
jgi:hypothetical protein